MFKEKQGKCPDVSPPPTQTDDQKYRVVAVVAATLNTAEAAMYLGVKPGTISTWRWQGRGPKFCKIGKKVMYTRPHLDEYRAAHTFTSTTEAQAAAKREVQND